MYDAVEPLLEGKRVALFGSYDWNDGEWMELWEQRADEAGLNVVDSVIAKDYPDDDAAAECMRLWRAAGITQLAKPPIRLLRRLPWEAFFAFRPHNHEQEGLLHALPPTA